MPAGPSLATTNITPHVVRHTTAMHVLPAGGDIATIALGLGQASIDTTHRCSGLQSKRTGTAISAFSGPHSLHLSPTSGPHSLHLRLQSAARDCNQRRQDHIICT